MDIKGLTNHTPNGLLIWWMNTTTTIGIWHCWSEENISFQHLLKVPYDWVLWHMTVLILPKSKARNGTSCYLDFIKSVNINQYLTPAYHLPLVKGSYCVVRQGRTHLSATREESQSINSFTHEVEPHEGGPYDFAHKAPAQSRDSWREVTCLHSLDANFLSSLHSCVFGGDSHK